jgi:glycosyltransferase involved in cell wall biosynthesis
MFHFFPHYAKDVTDTPFAAELRRLQIPHRFFSAKINLRYRTIFGLLFNVYPRLTFLAIRCAIHSLLLSHPRPTAIIVNTEVEALVFGSLRRILRMPTLVVYETMILSRYGNPVFRRYYEIVLSVVDVGICHSSIEVRRYAGAFPRARCRFVCVPFGTTVNGREALMAAYAVGDRNGPIVAAGRSSRDYQTLIDAIDGLPCRLRIICDTAAPVAQVKPSEQITIARDCFGMDYIEELGNAVFVVVPLAATDVSAGQMVLLQATALGKAVIITRTDTTVEYAIDGQDALLVDMYDVKQMRAAVCRLLDDRELRARLGAAAAQRFERDHRTEAYVRNLVSVTTSLLDSVWRSRETSGTSSRRQL